MIPAGRHSRQERFSPIGGAGQAKIAAGTAVVIGCGALGTVAAEQLARAGIGRLRLVDRDLVEPSNLQRQSLFSEADAAACRPKAEAAAARLRQIAGGVIVEPLVADAQPSNVAALIAGAQVVIDGADNFPTRHLVNEACCRAGIPFAVGACVGAYGLSLTVLPGITACLRCVQSELPAAGDGPTCDTQGIIAPAVHLVAAWQVAEALKILVGDLAAVRRELWAGDLWSNRFQRISLTKARDPGCLVCGRQATFPLLTAGDDPAVVLCGRDAIQVRCGPVDLAALGKTLGNTVVICSEHLVRWQADGITGTCFRDGRVLVQGVSTPAAARGFCARWLG